MDLFYYVAHDKKTGQEFHFSLDAKTATNELVMDTAQKLAQGYPGTYVIYRNLYTNSDPLKSEDPVNWHPEGLSISIAEAKKSVWHGWGIVHPDGRIEMDYFHCDLNEHWRKLYRPTCELIKVEVRKEAK